MKVGTGDGRHRKLPRADGALAEALAAEFLAAHGYLIRERNFQCRLGEIDIIAIAPSPALLVFVEVRRRRASRFGSGSESVDQRKQRKIVRAAAMYLSVRRVPDDWQTRFDVIGVGASANEIDWTRGAFWLEGEAWL